MSELVSPLLQWLNAHPQYAGLVTFIISAAESIAIIGTIVPGSITMTALGALAGAGVIPLWDTLIWAILGAIVGDGISYWIGYYYKDRLPFVWPFSRYPNLLITGEKFFYRYGGMSVFIGRFVGPVRALVPLVAGMLGTRPFTFIIANVTSAIGWAPAYMLPGIILGAASQELPSAIAVNVLLVLVLITLFILLCLWFIYKSLQLIHNQTTYLQDVLWVRLKRNRFGQMVRKLLRHHNPAMTHGQLTLATYFLLTGIFFIGFASYIYIVTPQAISINQDIFRLFRGLRHASLDHLLIGITLLGQKQIMLPSMLLVSGWLFLRKHYNAAGHVLVLAFCATGIIYGLKHLLKIPRPWGVIANIGSYSMPSGHTTLATAVFMGLAFFTATTINKKWHKYIYGLGLLIIFLVGISRLYLGAHWLTDVISSWLLGATLIIGIIISYQRTYETPPAALSLNLISMAAFCICFTFYYHTHINSILAGYHPLAWPTVRVNQQSWWQQKQKVIPTYYASVFGFATQEINIEWAGKLSAIERSLKAEGWMQAPVRDLISTMHRIADVSSTQYLPLISPQYLDKYPSLTLTRNHTGKGLMFIRIWDTHRVLKPGHLPLWVGIVGIIPRPYSWLFKKKDELNINPELVFPLQKQINLWRWQLVTVTLDHGKHEHLILYIQPK